MSDQRETTDQLDLFRNQPAPEPGASLTESTPEERVTHFRGQLTELPGETFEDIFE